MRSHDDGAPGDELDQILDRLGYEVTAARSAGLGRVSDLRNALRRARALVADAEALAGASEAGRRVEDE